MSISPKISKAELGNNSHVFGSILNYNLSILKVDRLPYIRSIAMQVSDQTYQLVALHFADRPDFEIESSSLTSVSIFIPLSYFADVINLLKGSWTNKFIETVFDPNTKIVTFFNIEGVG